jgi:hypothetical protein
VQDPEVGRAEAKEQVRKELGDNALALVEMDEEVTLDHLLKILSIEEKLDALIDKDIKRLLMVRGAKSLLSPSSTTPSKPRLKTAA